MARRTMHRSSRGLLATVLVGMLVSVSLMVTASPAAAHTKLSPYPTSCPGSEISHQHRTFSQGTVTVFIFYSTVNSGTNCAWGQKQFSRGTPTSINIQLARCATGNPNNACNPTAIDGDPGDYRYYVGPVRLTNAAGKCISYRVRVGSVWSAWSPPGFCS